MKNRYESRPGQSWRNLVPADFPSNDRTIASQPTLEELPPPPARGNFQEVQAQLLASYHGVAEHYRASDEIHVTGDYHQRLRRVLIELSTAFARPISVLDAGCGTGRYFHCIRNATRLVGLDLSAEMLQQAQNPVKAEEVTAKRVDLVCGSIYEIAFPPGSFDLIYSLGMFGNGCTLTLDMLDRFYDWLGPDGMLFFDLFDRSKLPRSYRFKQQVRRWLLPLAETWRQRIHRKAGVPLFSLTAEELEEMLAKSKFPHRLVISRECRTPMGHGAKLECVVHKHPKAQFTFPSER